jgi:signal peptidase I
MPLEELGPEQEIVEQVPTTTEEIIVEEQPYHPMEGERVSLARTFGGRSLLREILETALLTAIIFLVLNTTTGRFQVRGSSMEPTLFDGQYLLISKVTYWIHPPERGDVIVFHPPNNLSDDYIKRVVGLPGEHVEIQGGGVSINGVQLQEPYIANPGSYSGVWDLGEEEYFVLGDNRRNSSDSHTWGVFPGGNIVGKAWLCYWPPEQWSLVTHYTFPDLVEEAE